MNSLQTCKQKTVLVRLNTQPKEKQKKQNCSSLEKQPVCFQSSMVSYMVVSLFSVYLCLGLLLERVSDDAELRSALTVRNDFIRCQKSNTDLHS